MKRTLALGALVAAMLAARPAAAEAAELHVAPDGNDAWSGTRAQPNADKSDGPVASLAGARDALRKLRAAKPVQGPVRILVAAGRYSPSRAKRYSSGPSMRLQHRSRPIEQA